MTITGAVFAVKAAAVLVSRTIPHPEWAQISDQIEQTAVIRADRGSESLQTTLRPSEGGRVTFDFGAVTTGSFRPKANDCIHVRGKAIEQEGHVTILGQEVYAEGKVFSIDRGEAAAQDTGQASPADGPGAFPPSPAAPAPSR
jgi:hypothetical protein